MSALPTSRHSSAQGENAPSSNFSQRRKREEWNACPTFCLFIGCPRDWFLFKSLGALMEVAQFACLGPLRTKQNSRWLAAADTVWSNSEKVHDLRLLLKMGGKEVECVSSILALQRAA